MVKSILVVLGVFLILSLVFGIGFLVGRGTEKAPIIIEQHSVRAN